MSTKGQTLNDAAPVIHTADVKYHEGPILLPHGMSIPIARDVLKRKQEELETEITLTDSYDVFPYDGAHALEQVLIELLGWAPATATPGFWGPTPPQFISIEIGYKQKREVPWGSFSLPGVQGLLQTDVNIKNGRFIFALSATVLKKDEKTIKDIFHRVREYLKEGSIYKGKAIKIRFLDDNGKPLKMPEPEFVRTDHITREMAVYSDVIADAIETNLFTPIERVKDLLDNGIPVKRTVLLGGTYGTGKTLGATVASKIAVDNGITYVYIPRADELKQGIEFLKQYQSPAGVLFCEDIDRVLKGERTVQMDDILNIVDGIDTKSSHLITVLTTNDLEAINPAMIRPGRLDCVIEVTPPDAKAVERLIRFYAGESLDPDADLAMAGEALKGRIPAVIAEVVKRAKLVQLKKTPSGAKITGLTEDAIVEAALTIKNQLDLLDKLIERTAPKETPTLDKALAQVVDRTLAEREEAE